MIMGLCVKAVSRVGYLGIHFGNQPRLSPTSMTAVQDTPVSRRLRCIKHIIIVCSGKGGVGKSSVAVQLALTLYASSPDARVGILDIDLTGPSIPRMLGVDGSGVHQSSDGWVPVYADASDARLACMSVGFLLKNRGDSVVWRGPKKNAMIRQFLSDVRWGDLDYLVIDTPPGEPAPTEWLTVCQLERRNVGRTPFVAGAPEPRA
jgi:Mrp family chromosome partitioning ATPase